MLTKWLDSLVGRALPSQARISKRSWFDREEAVGSIPSSAANTRSYTRRAEDLHYAWFCDLEGWQALRLDIRVPG